MNKSTQTAETGEVNAPRANFVVGRNGDGWYVENTIIKSFLVYGQPDALSALCLAERRTGFPIPLYGEQCVYCGKDSWTCEHFDPRDEAERNQ